MELPEIDDLGHGPGCSHRYQVSVFASRWRSPGIDDPRQQSAPLNVAHAVIPCVCVAVLFGMDVRN
eukprot:8515707-Lingulodinium_polyedra.AAC.1